MFKFRIPALLIVTTLLAGCGLLSPISGSGNVVTQEEAITGFEKLDVSHGFNVDISQGDTFSVIIRADDNLIEHVRVVKEGSTLKIGLKPGRNYRLEDVTLEADITMPELIVADLAGGSHLGGDIETGDVTLNLSGGSHVTLSGSAGDITVDASGGSHAKLAGLAVVDANVEATGGSHATVNSSGRLDAVARGGSHVTYLGSPSLGTMDLDESSFIQQER
jgi:serine/threonine-protein kinase